MKQIKKGLQFGALLRVYYLSENYFDKITFCINEPAAVFTFTKYTPEGYLVISITERLADATVLLITTLPVISITS